LKWLNWVRVLVSDLTIGGCKDCFNRPRITRNSLLKFISSFEAIKAPGGFNEEDGSVCFTPPFYGGFALDWSLTPV